MDSVGGKYFFIIMCVTEEMGKTQLRHTVYLQNMHTLWNPLRQKIKIENKQANVVIYGNLELTA